MSPQPPELELVKPTIDPNPAILLYGAPKTGKTIGAASAPKPLLFLNADRPNATRYAHRLHDFDEVHVKDLGTLFTAVQVLQEGRYKSVVLDPVGEAYTAILEGLSRRATRPALPLRGDTSVHLERICRKLCELPVNAVFVAHELPHRDEDTGTFERLPYTGTNNPVFAGKLMAMVDVIGYTAVVPQDSGPPRYQASFQNERGRRGGDRLGGALGESRELNLTQWVEVAHKATAQLDKPQQKGAAT